MASWDRDGGVFLLGTYSDIEGNEMNFAEHPIETHAANCNMVSNKLEPTLQTHLTKEL